MTTPTGHDVTDPGQQVFKPVPTNDDIRALQHQIRHVERGRARLLVASVFLSGIVLASAVALGLMYTHTNTRLSEAETAAKAQADVISQKDSQIAKLSATIGEKQAVIDGLSDFQSVTALQQQIDKLESEIEALLAQPSRANAPARLKKLPEDVEWLDDVVTALRGQRDALLALKKEVEAWPPTLQDPRPD